MIEPDFYLQTLINIVNRNPGVNVPITVTVNGILISGWIIGGKEYFETFAKDFSDAFDGAADQKSKLQSMLAAPASRYEPEKLDDDAPHYLHLRDARVLDGGTAIPEKGVLWRVRADAVDSMTLGLLGD